MSKGLEAFKRIKSYFNPKQLLTKEKTLNDLDTIEKELKAFEIIKDKKVDVPFIIENPEAENVFWYNSSFTGVLCEGWRMISQEEYDLLREVLKWNNIVDIAVIVAMVMSLFVAIRIKQWPKKVPNMSINARTLILTQ